MADILNLPNCGGTTSTLNTGFPLCDVIRKAPKALVLVDAGVTFSVADRASVATFVDALSAATLAARGGRAYPILDLTNYEDASKEATKAAIGNLSTSEITMQEGVPAFNFQHYKGDLFQQQLIGAEGGGYELFIIDEGNVIYGTKSGTDFKGFSLSEFKTQMVKFATASEPAKYPFSIVLSSITEYKNNLAFLQLDSTVFNIKGLKPVDLNNPGAPPVQATNVIKITPVANGGKNIGLLYSTELAVVGAWTAVNDQTAAAHTITSVAWDAALERFNVTLDSTAYTALTSGDTVSVDLASAFDLEALGVDGYESIGPVTVTKA